MRIYGCQQRAILEQRSGLKASYLIIGSEEMTNALISDASILGIKVPDSKLGRAITEFIRDTENDLLFNHSSRVFFFGAIAGAQRGLTYNPELLYAAAMFHDVGLVPSHSSDTLRFEVDGANAARDFLASHGVDPSDIERVWTGIALHTTPGVPEFMHPVIALTTAGVEMDVLGLTYSQYDDDVREAVVAAFPRSANFKEDIIQAFYDGIKDKPQTTFGNVKADVIADKEPHFHRGNFCSVIRKSAWSS
jgi:HD domain